MTAYVRKGGREANIAGRVCLCNALFASAGYAQRRPGGRVEPALVTIGEDLAPVAELLAAAAARAGAALRRASVRVLGPGRCRLPARLRPLGRGAYPADDRRRGEAQVASTLAGLVLLQRIAEHDAGHLARRAGRGSRSAPARSRRPDLAQHPTRPPCAPGGAGRPAAPRPGEGCRRTRPARIRARVATTASRRSHSDGEAARASSTLRSGRVEQPLAEHRRRDGVDQVPVVDPVGVLQQRLRQRGPHRGVATAGQLAGEHAPGQSHLVPLARPQRDHVAGQWPARRWARTTRRTAGTLHPEQLPALAVAAGLHLQESGRSRPPGRRRRRPGRPAPRRSPRAADATGPPRGPTRVQVRPLGGLDHVGQQHRPGHRSHAAGHRRHPAGDRGHVGGHVADQPGRRRPRTPPG